MKCLRFALVTTLLFLTKETFSLEQKTLITKEIGLNLDHSAVVFNLENPNTDELVFCKELSVLAQFFDENEYITKMKRISAEKIFLNPSEEKTLIFGQEVFKELTKEGLYFQGLAENSFFENCHIERGSGLHPGLDIKFYLSTNGDLINAFGEKNYKAALIHWEKHGKKEGRRPSPEFDVHYYLSTNPDMPPKAGINNTKEAEEWWKTIGENDFERAYHHWVKHGRFEGRRGAPLP